MVSLNARVSCRLIKVAGEGKLSAETNKKKFRNPDVPPVVERKEKGKMQLRAEEEEKCLKQRSSWSLEKTFEANQYVRVESLRCPKKESKVIL